MSILFKFSLIAYKIVKKIAPAYLTEMVEMFVPTTDKNLRPGY